MKTRRGERDGGEMDLILKCGKGVGVLWGLGFLRGTWSLQGSSLHVFLPTPPSPSYSRSIMIDRTQVALCICVNLHLRLHFLLSPTSHHFSSLGLWGLPQTHKLTIQRSETDMFKVQ